jgi:hypothetical protein
MSARPMRSKSSDDSAGLGGKSKQKDTVMSYGIIRGQNGRRHEVDFGDAPIRVEIHASEETVEIFVEADFEKLPQERRRFIIVSIPRHQFSKASGEAARRVAKPS